MPPTFNEILGMRLDFSEFLQDFEKFKVEYQKKIKSLDEIEISSKAQKVVDSLGINEVSKEISNLTKAFSEFSDILKANFVNPIKKGADEAAKAMQNLGSETKAAFTPLKEFNVQDIAKDEQDVINTTELLNKNLSELVRLIIHRQELHKQGTDLTSIEKEIKFLEEENRLLIKVNNEQDKLNKSKEKAKESTGDVGGIGGNEGDLVRSSKAIADEQLKLVRAGKMFEQVTEDAKIRQADFRQLALDTQEILFREISQGIETGGEITFDKLTQINQKWFADQKAIRAKDDVAYDSFLQNREALTKKSLDALSTQQKQLLEIQDLKQKAISQRAIVFDSGEATEKDRARAEQSVENFTKAEEAKRAQIAITREVTLHAHEIQDQAQLNSIEKTLVASEKAADKRVNIAIRSEEQTSAAIEKIRNKEIASEEARNAKREKIKLSLSRVNKQFADLQFAQQGALDEISKAPNVDLFKTTLAELEKLVQDSFAKRTAFAEQHAKLDQALATETNTVVIQGIRNELAIRLDAYNESIRAAEKFAASITKKPENALKDLGLSNEQLKIEREKANVIRDSQDEIGKLKVRSDRIEERRQQSELERNKAVESNKSQELINALDKRLQAIKDYFAAVERLTQVHNAKIKEASSQQTGIFNKSSQIAVDFEEANKAVSKTSKSLALADDTVGRVKEKATGLSQIFASFSKDIFKTIGTVAKFGLIWNTVGFIIEGALFPFKLFVKSLQDGFTFLVNLQQKLADVRENLVQNVTFAKNLADNFELAGKVATFLTLEQERAAALIGVEADKFRQVFESFSSTGGIKGVKRATDDTEQALSRAVRTSALLVAALNAVGVGSENTRRQTTEIGKLLEGQVTQRDRIRIASGLTVKELNKQSLEAQKQGKFLEFVEGLFGAQVKRLESANDRFKELNTQVQFFVNRLQAAFVEQIFSEVVKALKDVLKFLKENEKELIVFARIGGATFKGFLVLLLEIGKTFGVVFKGVFELVGKIITLDGVLNDTTDSLHKLGEESSSISNLNDLSLALFRTFQHISLVVFAVNNGLKAMFQILKNGPSGLDPVGRFFNVSSDRSKAAKDYTEALKTITESEEKFVKKRGELLQEEDNLRFTIGSLSERAAKDIEHNNNKAAEDKIKNANEDKKRLEANLEEQKRIETKFLSEKAEFDKKKQKAIELDSAIVLDTTFQAFDDQKKLLDKEFDELRKLGKKQEKQGLPTIIGFPKKEGPETKPKFDNAQLQDALRQFKEDADLIRNLFAELRDDVNQAVAANEKDIIPARSELISLFKSQGEALTGLANDFIKNLNKIKGAANPKDVEKTKDQLVRAKIDAEEESRKAIAKIIREGTAEEKAQELERLKNSIETLTQEGNARINLIKSQVELGVKLRSDVAQEEIELNRQIFEESLKINDLELDLADQNQSKIEKILIDRARSIITFNEKNAQLVNERIKLLEEELIATEEQARAIFEVRNNLNKELNELAKKGTATEFEKTRIDNLNLQLESKSLDLRVKQNQLEFESNERQKEQIRAKLAEFNIIKLTRDLDATEAQQLLFSQKALEEKSQIYRRLKVQQEELTSELVKQNEAIAEGNVRQNRGLGSATLNFLTGREVDVQRFNRNPQAQATVIRGVAARVTSEPVKKFLNDLADEVEKNLTKQFGGKFNKFKFGIDTAADAILGLASLITNLAGAFREGIGQGITALGGIIRTIGGSIGQLGTALPKIGKALSGIFGKGFGKTLGKIFEAAGPIAEIIGVGVQLFSAIFSRAAKRIAEDIKKNIERITKNLDRGITGLGDTIVELEKQRVDAIRRLSGKKGGQKELDQILPGLEDQIFSLKKQQKDVQEAFEDQLSVLRLNSDALVSFNRSWKDVVKTVKDYLDSFAKGEDLLKAQANAAEFLSLSLKKIREDFLDQIESEEQSAIDSAIEFNDLLKEREDLLKDLIKLQEEFNKAQFDLLTEDAVEARVAGVVERGNKIVQLRKDFEESKAEKEDRLRELNVEIAHQARIVAQQKQIFNLASSTADLKARSNALEEASLQRQLDKIRQIKEVVDGIKENNGVFTIDPALLAAAGINPNTTTPQGIQNPSAQQQIVLNSSDFDQSSEKFRLSSDNIFGATNTFDSSVSKFSQTVDNIPVNTFEAPAVVNVDFSKVESSLDTLSESTIKTSKKLLTIEPPKQQVIDVKPLDDSLTSASSKFQTSLKEVTSTIKDVTTRLENIDISVPKIIGLNDFETSFKEIIKTLNDVTIELNQISVPLPEVTGFDHFENSLNSASSILDSTINKLEKIVIPVPKITGLENLEIALKDTTSFISNFTKNPAFTFVEDRLLSSMEGFTNSIDDIEIPKLEIADTKQVADPLNILVETLDKIFVQIKSSFELVTTGLKDITLNTVSLKDLTSNLGNITNNNNMNTILTNPTFIINVPEGVDGVQFGRDMLGVWQEEQTRFGFNNQ